MLQGILFGHEFHEFSRSNSLKFVKIREIRVKKGSLAAPTKESPKRILGIFLPKILSYKKIFSSALST
jgi:hypothetical protein